jgi:Holliday junction resolvasome RuvABC DNA-binding subunit
VPVLTLRLTTEQAARLAADASKAGVSREAYVRDLLLHAPDWQLVREIHAAVTRGTPQLRLPPEAIDAVAALVAAGLTEKDASARVGRLVAANPQADAAELVRLAVRRAS